MARGLTLAHSAFRSFGSLRHAFSSSTRRALLCARAHDWQTYCAAVSGHVKIGVGETIPTSCYDTREGEDNDRRAGEEGPYCTSHFGSSCLISCVRVRIPRSQHQSSG